MRKAKQKAPFVSCIIAAAGRGSRMQAEVNKIFLEFGGMPVLAHTLLAFERHPAVHELIIVTAECDLLGCRDVAEEFSIGKLKTITRGGAQRQDSVRNALREVSPQADVVLIHDAARPLVTADAIQRVIDGVADCGAAAAGVRCKNTLKRADDNGMIIETPDRSHMYEIQTPQGFTYDLICRAHRQAEADGVCGTDDCYLAERLGAPVQITDGSYGNIKITTPEDLPLAEQLYISMTER